MTRSEALIPWGQESDRGLAPRTITRSGARGPALAGARVGGL